MRKTTNYFDLNKCSTLIAGGATGLGFEMAKGLLSVGCDVTIIGRTEERVKKSADILNEEYDSTCSGLKCDISDEKSLSNILERFSIENSGKLNVAINSAGFNIRNKIEDI